MRLKDGVKLRRSLNPIYLTYLKMKFKLIFLLSNQVKKEEQKKEVKKYTVKPPKDLRSKYEIKMDKRREKEEADLAEKMAKEQETIQLV